MQKLVDIAQAYGKNFEIKFNPDKTVCMVVSNKRNPTSPVITMDSHPVKIVSFMKYLGTKLTTKLQNKEHVENRIVSSKKRCFMLERSGFNSTEITPRHKISLYKVYVRPIILYGLEPLMLTQQETQKLQLTEANLIKSSLRLSHRCRTKKLLSAIGIETTANTIKRSKSKLLLRIMKNPFTHELVTQLVQKKQGKTSSVHSRSLLKEISNINGVESDTTVDLEMDTLLSLGILDEEIRTNGNNEQVLEIKYLLDNYDYRKDAEKLSEILRAF